MMTATTLRADVEARLASARSRLDSFLALPADESPSRVLEAWDAIARPLDVPLSLWFQVLPEAELRDLARELQQDVSSFLTELGLSRPAWEKLSALDAGALEDPEERRLLEHALRDFRRSGVDRDQATRERIRALTDELVVVGQEFAKNIAGDTRELVIPEGRAGLNGLPEDWIAAHPERGDGSVVVTTDPPDLMAFLTFAERRDLREKLWQLSADRAWPANGPVLDRMLALRHELAGCLGYASWAHYVTEDKMVGSPETVSRFIERVRQAAAPRVAAELAELRALQAALDPADPEVHPWDRAFLTEKVRREKLDFDSQSVRPYLAYERVRDGVLATSAALFGIEFRRDDQRPRWHESVECYEVFDGGALVARLWLDMHPRPDKYKHAAMFGIRDGIAGGDVPEACLVCNFTRPGPGEPALMLHRQVQTFFHEFGHLLHHLFSRQRFFAFAGIATEWDFVEVPSKMYEEWAWDAGVLQRFATHVETGERISADLVRRLRAAEEYGKGIVVAQQMYYARLALSLFERDPAGLDVMEHALELARELAPIPMPAGSHFPASFGHLEGYSALYYTYAWSEVIAKDCFSRFEADLMDGATANEYRRAVLSAGGSRDAADLVRAFLGRDYSFDAWRAWMER